MSAMIFLVIGIVKIIEEDYLTVATSLISTLVFVLTALKIFRGKINFNQTNEGLKIFFPIGFVFSIAGGSGYMNAGVWGFGLTLMLVGMLFSPKQEERIKEGDNAG